MLVFQETDIVLLNQRLGVKNSTASQTEAKLEALTHFRWG